MVNDCGSVAIYITVNNCLGSSMSEKGFIHNVDVIRCMV